MAANTLNGVLRQLRRVALLSEHARLADRQLLDSYVTARDEGAFEALLRRHGPMVLGVCRRILRNEAEAEDAFQATFLVLVRKAASIRRKDSVGSWLYGVAHHTALKAKAMNRIRCTKEREARAVPKAEAAEEARQQLQALLETELRLLPENYHAAIVACDLEGKTLKEAARQLGWPEGTVASRLARGRALLARRLSRHGLTFSASVLAALLSAMAVSASVSPALLGSTMNAARLWAAGQAATTGAVSASVAALTEGVLTSMFVKKLKNTVAVLLVAALACLGAGVLLSAPPASGRAKAPQEAKKPDSRPVQATKKGETLNCTGVVLDKDTGKPIAGAIVTVRRSLFVGDGKLQLMQETKHKTNAKGTYRFTIPPEQAAKRNLYVELDVEHSDYAPGKDMGYALSTIRAVKQLETRLYPGKAITGTVKRPDGQPAPGVQVTAFSFRKTKDANRYELPSYADCRTDAKGHFRLMVTAPGQAGFAIVPEHYAPVLQLVKDGMRGDLGTFTLQRGHTLRGKVLDVAGKPLPGMAVTAGRAYSNEEPLGLLGDSWHRRAVTNDNGEFILRPLGPGEYLLVGPRDGIDSKKGGKKSKLPHVFLNRKVVLKEDKSLEIRAVPHVVIEVQHYDSKAKPARTPFFSGWVIGDLDRMSWSTYPPVRSDGNGKFTLVVPHGLENASLEFLGLNTPYKYRVKKGAKLQDRIGTRLILGTLTEDLRIEIHHPADVDTTKAPFVIGGPGAFGKKK